VSVGEGPELASSIKPRPTHRRNGHSTSSSPFTVATTERALQRMLAIVPLSRIT
jgi:hypothetical protein